MSSTLAIPSTFCGPPGTANGGYLAGRLAGLLPGERPDTVDVSLRRPPALEVPLEAVTAQDGLRLCDPSGELVATAQAVCADLDPVEPVTPEEAEAATGRFLGLDAHPFPGCYVCGTDRRDGLRIFPGPVAAAPTGDPRVAATWCPSAELAQESEGGPERTGLAVAWAALDCIGGWAGDLSDRVMVLARMTARVDTLPVVGEPHVVTGQAMSRQGRKTTTAATLWDADGRVVGTARHLWITVDPEQVGDARTAGAAR